MHGRLKVKSTAEQEAAKQQEREKKIQKYLMANKIITEKRKNMDRDQELFEVTGQLLSSNPDYYTLWNIRREVLLEWKASRENNEMEEIFENELNFLEQCLRINPKSYGSWYHRCWILKEMQKPDWSKELFLCNKYLEYDERNFHCWDFRRFVVERSSVSPYEELKYTTEKISSNFSNYSSWHYRSKLMPHVHADPSHAVGIKENILLQEFELAQNAFFTDPNDQSAWFYHRWLLGRGERPLSIEMVIIDKEIDQIIIVFNKAMQDVNDQLEMDICGIHMSLVYNPVGNDSYSKLWTAQLDPEVCIWDGDVELTMQLKKNYGCKVDMSLTSSDVFKIWRKHYKSGTRFNCELSAATADILYQELESCEQLHQLEPDNKWTLLTIVLLMHALDPLKYEPKALQYLEKLETTDSMRKNYYRDLRSKLIIENAIEQLDDTSHEIDLSGRKLTTLCHLELLSHLEIVNLSNNSLSDFKEIQNLQSVKMLSIDNNAFDEQEANIVMKNLPKINLSEIDRETYTSGNF